MQFNGLFIGLTTIDIQYFVDLFPESNKKVKTLEPDILVGGPATNAAVAFSHLNNGAYLASALGGNSFNSFVENDFYITKIKHFDLVDGQNVNPVIASVVTSNNNGDRNIFTHHPGKIQSGISVNRLFTNVKPDIILLDGFYPEFSIECAKLAKRNNATVVIDGGSWKPQYKELIKFADVIICSEDFHPPECKSSQQVFNYLQTRGINRIAISRGDKSILFQEGQTQGEIAVSAINAVDTLGAGDFLHGAFCYFYQKSNDFKNALRMASIISSFSCQYKGTRKWLKLLK